MASEKNLSAVFTDIANSIRSKKGTTGAIQPINMASEIDGIQAVGEKSFIYKLLESKGIYWTSALCGTGWRYATYNSFSKLTEIKESDIPPSSGVYKMDGMFYECLNLTAIPQLDTRNVTDMNGMFGYCEKLTAIPALDTSKVTSMYDMFTHCRSITTIPALDTSKVTRMDGMFSYCSKLTTIPALDTSKVTRMDSMFNECTNLTAIPKLDTSNVTMMTYMFYNCQNLTEIPELDVSKVNSLGVSVLYNCINLKAIYMKNIKADLDISTTGLEHDGLVELINNGLATVTTTKTLTMGSAKLALLSDNEKQVALDKGWTLA